MEKGCKSLHAVWFRPYSILEEESSRDIEKISGCEAQRKGRVTRRSTDNLKRSEMPCKLLRWRTTYLSHMHLTKSPQYQTSCDPWIPQSWCQVYCYYQYRLFIKCTSLEGYVDRCRGCVGGLSHISNLGISSQSLCEAEGDLKVKTKQKQQQHQQKCEGLLWYSFPGCCFHFPLFFAQMSSKFSSLLCLKLTHRKQTEEQGGLLSDLKELVKVTGEHRGWIYNLTSTITNLGIGTKNSDSEPRLNLLRSRRLRILLSHLRSFNTMQRRERKGFFSRHFTSFKWIPYTMMQIYLQIRERSGDNSYMEFHIVFDNSVFYGVSWEMSQSPGKGGSLLQFEETNLETWMTGRERRWLHCGETKGTMFKLWV